MKKGIYLDNASTSFPKAPGVSEAMARYIDLVGANVARGGYDSAYEAAGTMLDAREALSKLFSAPGAKNIIFTQNVTASLNFIIKGFLKPGDHVLLSSMEHNAVMRPVVQMEKTGVSFDRIPCDINGELEIDAVEKMIRGNTKMMIMMHASNVCGSIMPIEKIGEICRKHGLFFTVDAAQTAGILPINMGKMNIDALCFTGHKSLMGPQGIGGLAITDNLSSMIDPIISGGTGSISDSEQVPNFMPDKFEAGTPNLPGIFGLLAALEYINKTGMEKIFERETALANRLREGAENIKGVRIIGNKKGAVHAPVVSLDFEEKDNAEAAFALAEEFGIMTRCGLHCAPSAHKTLGTFPQGTVRFSISHFNTEDEIDRALNAIYEIAGRA